MRVKAAMNVHGRELIDYAEASLREHILTLIEEGGANVENICARTRCAPYLIEGLIRQMVKSGAITQ